MQFSYNWLQSFFDKKLPAPEKVVEKLTMHSFEVKSLKEVKLPSGNKDIILDIDVLPNRTHDCYSHFGIATEISALFNMQLKPVDKPKLKTIKEKAEKYLELEVKEPVLCRRYLAGVMLDIKVGPSPIWLQERLIALGQRSINNIVDCSNYVMSELGQPLHAFDREKLNPVKIVVRRAVNGERITTLDNRNIELDSEILVIADSSEPLAIAGIKGGKKAEIDMKTRNIIIESANFEPANIRLTSKKIGLATGASFGFENGISVALVEKALERVMTLIQETGGGKIVEGRMDFYPKKYVSPKIIFTKGDVAKLLGVKISEKEILSIFEGLGIKTKKAKDAFIAIPPSERLDLVIKEDIIEEIVRIHGLENIPTEVPEGLLVPPARNDNYFYENIVRSLMAGAGFSEVYNYSFVPTGEISVENPISDDKKFLRANLLDGLKDNVKENFKYCDEVKIFEIGKVFGKSGERLDEKNILAGIVARKNPSPDAEEFYEIKGALDSVFSALGIVDFWFDDTPRTAEVKSGQMAGLAEIRIGGKGIGFIDENSFELDLGQLVKFATEEIEYRPVSKYPAVTRDVAVLVPLETKMTSVTDVIENTAGELLIDSDLFDLYESEELGKSKKSLAFHLIFQSRDRTLSDKEVNVLMEKIIKALDSVEDWEVRK